MNTRSRDVSRGKDISKKRRFAEFQASNQQDYLTEKETTKKLKKSKRNNDEIIEKAQTDPKQAGRNFVNSGLSLLVEASKGYATEAPTSQRARRNHSQNTRYQDIIKREQIEEDEEEVKSSDYSEKLNKRGRGRKPNPKSRPVSEFEDHVSNKTGKSRKKSVKPSVEREMVKLERPSQSPHTTQIDDINKSEFIIECEVSINATYKGAWKCHASNFLKFSLG